MAAAEPYRRHAQAAEAAPAQPESSRGRSSYTAEIIPQDQVPVVAEVAGQVLEFSIEVGDRVEAGDVLSSASTAAR